MSFPAHHVGSYVGTGAALEVTEPGFKPSFIRIYNDTDNDVAFDYFQGQASGIAVKTGAGTLTPTALSLTFVGSTPTFTGSTPAFTGTAPYSPATSSVTHDAAPGGNKIYLKYSGGRPYLASNIATDTVSKIVSFSSGKLMIMHEAGAASLGHEVMCTDAGVLQCDNTMSGADEFVQLVGGGLLKVAHNATPGSQSLYYDDGADQRLECAFSDLANHNISSESQGWKSVTPAGTNAQVTGTVAQVTGTVTGNSGGSLGTSVSEVASQGITLLPNGFSLGTDSSINESGKTYRYIVLR